MGWRLEPGVTRDTPVEPGYNRPACVVAREAITERHRNIALLVAGCYFMEMLDREVRLVPT